MQDSFAVELTPLLVGQVTPGGVTERITLLAEEDIAFGKAVIRGTVEGQGKNIVDTNSVVVGIAERAQNIPGEYLGADSMEMPIVTKGNIAVEVVAADTPTAGDKAYVVVTAGADFGKFTTTAGTNIDAGLVFQGAKKTGNLAIVKLDINA